MPGLRGPLRSTRLRVDSPAAVAVHTAVKPYNARVPPADAIAGLLADLDTIAGLAGAAVLSRSELRLEEGETRPAAVLFVDVVGFSELSRKLTTEQLATLVDRSFRIFELTVKSHGGYCDKVIGDAGLYVFAGHPNHAPVCEAALCAGLDLLERAAQVNASLAQSGLGLELRAGVAFGDVTRKRAGGAELAESVFGETVNLAQRLQGSAPNGTLLTTSGVLDRAGDLFVTTDLGSKVLKGVGAVRTWRVDGLAPREVRLRGAFAALSPLVGRGELLEHCLAQVEAWNTSGGAALIVLQGPPAVGKSRLAYELGQRLAAHWGDGQCTLATAHCLQQAGLSTLLAEVCALARLGREGLVDRWEALCSLASERLGPEYAQRAQGSLPVLAHLLDCTEVDSSALRQADVNAFRLGCRVALHTALEMAALEGRRLLLVIEDIQWLGDSIEVLKGAFEGLGARPPLVILATARPEYTHSAGILGESASLLCPVEPLGGSAGTELLAALLPGLDLPPAVERELHSKASGLPYYYEEFARMLVRRGIAGLRAGTEAAPRYELVREVKELALPENVQALLLGRLDQLPRELKELAMHASVLGHSFKAELLARLEERLSAISETELQIRLGALTAEHVLVAEEAG